MTKAMANNFKKIIEGSKKFRSLQTNSEIATTF
jgi:hypothetical protein